VLTAIVRFEFARHVRSISTYIYFVVFFAAAFLAMAGTGGAITDSFIEIGEGKVLANSPYILHNLITLFGYFGMLVMAAIAGRAAYQDFETGSDTFLFSYPIRKAEYLAGRFLEAVLILILIFSSIGLGAYAATWLPGMDPVRLGPNRFLAYAMPYLTSIIPNILLTCAIFFSLGALSRKANAVYLGNVLLVTGYLIASTLTSDIENRWIASLVDPFGNEAGDRLTQYWTVAEKNVRLVGLEGLLLWNRVLWLGIGAALIAFTWWKFRLTLRGVGSKPAKSADVPAPAAPISVTHDFSRAASLRALFRLTWLDFTETVKNIYFGAIVLAGILVVCFAGRALGDMYGTSTYPVTYQTMSIAGGSFAIFMLILITFYSGELVWRERDAGTNELVDALPVPRWTSFLAKMLALFLIPALLQTVMMLAGIGIQLSKGYTRLEPLLYVKELLGLQLIGYLLTCVLALTVQTLVNNKYLGHFVMVLYYLASTFMGRFGFEQHIYNYGSDTGHIYSDMNGFGFFLRPELVFDAYWACAAVMLALLAHLFWVQGLATDWRWRLRVARQRFRKPAVLLLLAAGSAFAAMGAIILYNTHILHRYRTTWQHDELSKRYETRYRRYLGIAQPRITAANVAIDLYPSQGRFRAHGVYQIANKSNQPIAQVLVTLPLGDDWHVHRMQFSVHAELTTEDRDGSLRIYKLPQPLPPGATGSLDFDFEFAPRGFANSGVSTQVVENGTFLNNQSFPDFGYQEGAELSEDAVRRKHGLGPKPRMHDIDDPVARMRNDTSYSADWITLDTVISTEADQIAIAPGELVREWRQGSRRFFEYRTRGKALHFFCAVSARYRVLRDKWNDVDLAIYYHPGHEYNLGKMMQGMKDALTYCTTNFSPYQNKTLRILEFPRYESFAQSFLASVPYSESIGFIAHVDPSDEKDIDYPYYVTAHEVAHQWWGHQVVGADVQGAATISESLAQYTALMVMKKEFGPARMRRFLKYEMDRYLNGRSGETKKETPLVREEGQGYIHYNKGSVVFYALQDYIGEDNVNRALRAYLRKVAWQEPPYTTARELEAELRQVTPPQFQYAIDDMFDSITLYENKADSATYREVSKGKYEVTLKVSAKKFKADGLGAEKEVALADWIDIGVLDAKGNPLYLAKHKIEKTQTEFTLMVEGIPAKAGIDPWNKLVDRTPDDNVMAVSKM
jgi:ABC-type transport system involved in multi-copper enzyme maturation permease subunit